MAKKPKTHPFYAIAENNQLLLAIRGGMMLATPVIFAGATALLFLSFPVEPYQQFLEGFAGGFLHAFFTLVQSCTLDIISGVILFTVSYSIDRLESFHLGGLLPLVCLCSYLAFSYQLEGGLTFSIFESTRLFSALAVTLFSAYLYRFLYRRFTARFGKGAREIDPAFQIAFMSVVPFFATVAVFGLVNIFITLVLGVSDYQHAISGQILALFSHLGNNLFSGFLFIFLLHFFWFFGIHGGNLLDAVARQVFGAQLVQENAQRLAAGLSAENLFSKPFFDTFALFGGCGATLCLVLAITLAEKRRGMRRMAKLAALPSLFNMNELILFGFPVVLSPVYLIPFLLTPLLLTATSAFSMWLGLVPYVSHTVEWTTPIFISGYVATGSIAGSILQLVNLALGILLYIPFLRLAQKNQQLGLRRQTEALTKRVMQCEEVGTPPALTARGDALGTFARSMAEELSEALQNGSITLHYQPQVHTGGQVIGVEGLLRLHYRTGEDLYPPLVIALAEETGQMDALGDFLIERACQDIGRIEAAVGHTVHVSINLTASQLYGKSLISKIEAAMARHQIPPGVLGVEVTEQTLLTISPVVSARLEALRGMGVSILLDDFGMGHSSMMQLQNVQFDVVKLDGNLVREIEENSRSRDIISSILYLSHSLHFQVVAEFVETEAQRALLEELGCENYQGYLYSRPLPMEELLPWLTSQNMK